MSIPFNPALSLQLDKARAALEAAQANGDTVRELAARVWLARLEALIFGGEP